MTAGVTASEAPVSWKALTLYGVAFGLGVITGVGTYIRYLTGSRAVEPPVAGTHAIGIHVGLGIALVTGIALINRRFRSGRARRQVGGATEGVGGFWSAPFTERGWREWLFALTSLPAAFIELLGSARTSAARRWYLLWSLPIGVLLTLSSLLAVFMVWRAGLQVIGALDPNFCINAWGGPTYLGASAAHWMDAFIVFQACAVSIRSLSGFQTRLALRHLGPPTRGLT